MDNPIPTFRLKPIPKFVKCPIPILWFPLFP
nr:MAG TPA: hypothetical protein [Bacteriophage sp.]